MSFKQKKDLKFGLENEIKVLDLIRAYFKPNQIKKTDEYHPLDFISDVGYFEVKSRRNKYEDYKTTMIGYDKIEYAKTCDNDIYFIFIFENGSYYYKFDNDDKFQIKIGGRCDRGYGEYKLYYYIPIDILIPLKITKNDILSLQSFG